MAKAKTTITDVARDAEVSATTVSLILNGKGVFPPATRERVRESAARLGYHPSRSATSLRTGKTRTVGLVVTGSSDELWASQWVSVTARIMVEAAEEFNRRGYALLIIPSSALSWISPDTVDAIILSDSLPDDPVLNAAFDAGIPVLTNDRLEDQRVSVHIDSGYRDMTSYAFQSFEKAGRKRPGLLTEPHIFSTDSAPEELWRQLCRDRQIDSLVERVAYNRDNLHQAVSSLLDQGVDAIYSFAGEGAEVADIITGSGRKVGTDILLFSAEMDEGRDVTAWGGTVLRYRANEAGSRLVPPLLEVLEDSHPTPYTVSLGWEVIEPREAR